ncbi:MAG: gluconokinase [Paenibacillus macerans]|uniref:Gluconate kinase n=1 Tax=Paenibacillus macerans TaxID=44252 RepID=A0A090ZN37_PAEMA|nr:gluconokinase [Paenibacillus macerans]KFN12017.1 gluconate kinase [Paenibacillus macerans]MBS5912375.1 gluconokinase [Paenibacillus macerans]MCY7559089.1 gluconokinase [Paenibacillus macerans]MDU7472142.1 gluconokinase [Paenibacillus macerans]MEC0136360.1 gluconokinase [Paenibacillus macerans]
MNSLTYMIGLDIGTTSTKAVLFERSGKVVASANEEYPLYTPSASIAEQDPDEIFSAVVAVVRQIMKKSGLAPEQIGFVSFSTAMHSVIPVDKDGKPLMRCITWADNRSVDYAERLKNELGGHEIYLRTGTPIHPMSPLTKLMWLRQEQPDIFQKTRKFISIKEYVFLQLFGEYVIDYSIASCTGLLNLEKLDWDEEALRVAGITPEHLSKLVPTTHIMQGLSQKYADDMGLSTSTPFVIGASDGVLSNLGVDAIDPGVVAVTIGTSGAIRTVVDRPKTDPKGRIFCYALTDKHWVIGGPVNNGGVIFRWVRDEFAASEVETAKRLGISPYDVLTKIGERVNPGSDGLIFHPYLAGERAPLWNPNARGSFFGLTLHHQKEHMIRAVLEGVIYNLYTVLLAMEEQIGRPRKIQATGGFARSPLWRQMLADIFDQQVVIPESIESSCLGAAVLGLYALGEIDSFDIVKSMVGGTYMHSPNAKHTAVYKQILPIYIRISRKLEEEYEAIAKLQRHLTEG